VEEEDGTMSADSTQRTIQIQGFGGVFMYADDAESLAKWYVDVLNIQTTRYGKSWFVEWPSATRFSGSERISTVHFAIFQADNPLPERRTARIAFRVDDLDQVCAALEGCGQQVKRKPEMDDYGRFAWINDPEGNLIELWEPPLHTPNHTDALP